MLAQLRLLVLRDQQLNKELTILAGVIGPDHWEEGREAAVTLGKGSWKGCVWLPSDPVGNLLVISYPILMAAGFFLREIWLLETHPSHG